MRLGSSAVRSFLFPAGRIASLRSSERYLVLALGTATIATMVEVTRGLALGAVAADQLGLLVGYVLLFMLPLGAATLVMMSHRYAGLTALGSSLLPLAATAGFIASVVANPSLPYFASVLVSTVALCAAAALAILTLVEPRMRSRSDSGRVRAGPIASNLAYAFLGIAVGGLVIGLVAGASISALLAQPTNNEPDVVIVRGAYDHSQTEAYRPPLLVVTVGLNSTVTWYNADVEMHTVTSDDGQFDSGPIAPGGSWTLTFSESGDFGYYCRPHPWMKGVVTVR